MADHPDGNGVVHHMTSSERLELAKVVRKRERLAKAGTAVRAAELLAEFEQQMAAAYSFDDDATWAEAMKAAAEAVKEADRVVAVRCEELGIPRKYRPGIHAEWWGRGETASKERRSELRLVAKTRIAALEKQAKLDIERESLRVQELLVTGGLQSDEARAFMESMPTAETLMPTLSVAEIEAGS
jgi:hypothetical protein